VASDRAPWSPNAVQKRLTRYYQLEELPAVESFVSAGRDGARERLLVRWGDDGVEMALELPEEALRPGPLPLDAACQLVEGVSHFVLVAERARRELPITELELELQAEVDKFVVLALAGDRPLDAGARASLHHRLFRGARFVDPPGTLRGDRYRMAHRLALRFTRHLDVRYLRHGRHHALRETLRRFYDGGQTTKIELARAA
jgi:hypothetical protein